MRADSFLSFYLKTSTIRVFNRSIKKIDYPHFVRFLIHPTKLQIAMTAYYKKELTSFRVPRNLLNGDPRACLSIHSKKLCGLVARKMGWEDGRSYRIPGEMLQSKKAFVFYLEDAVEVTRADVPSIENVPFFSRVSPT